MSIVLFTATVLHDARRRLKVGSDLLGAIVDIGGYHFECGTRDFAIWSNVVKADAELALVGANPEGTELDFVEAYVRMRERAFELARHATNTGAAERTAVSESLNSFMKISRPTGRFAKVRLGSAKGRTDKGAASGDSNEEGKARSSAGTNRQSTRSEKFRKDPYSILGVEPTATQEELRGAYLARSRVIHPDRFDQQRQPQDWKKANEMLRELNEAYSILRNAESRAEYDRICGGT
ncbi:MAG: J domain-containing protein [Terriglobia bacterium]